MPRINLGDTAHKALYLLIEDNAWLVENLKEDSFNITIDKVIFWSIFSITLQTGRRGVKQHQLVVLSQKETVTSTRHGSAVENAEP
ncbi:hypothetical protein HYQ46_005307 [Verticillium longisporum]|nr:hypothetical protein HYQ46_005307 [Verticillium longisporum]